MPNHDPCTVLRWHIGAASTVWIVIRKSPAYLEN